ncbi:hypothetical protein HN935_01155 [archaeon]|jgi:hypothetical protein|nr:hypothetical protein [archaeon]
MTKESIFLGIAGIVIGIAIYIKTQSFLPALVPTIIGLALIFFANEENKIEKRNDRK